MELLSQISGLVWGPYMLLLILGTGALLMVRLGGMPILKIGYGFKQLFKGRQGQGEGDITPFGALMTSLSATIGTGNIAGVATAIGLGGPGALFWMWCSALVGMATKYSEAVCAVHFRETDDKGDHVGGPMYYIRNGLGPKWGWLGALFAVFAAFAGFGIGNSVQANSVASALNNTFDVDAKITAVVMMILVGLVLLGGIRRISEVATRLVPSMAVLYIVAGLLVLILNAGALPDAIVLVFVSAFSSEAVGGGAAGTAVMLAIQFGVARGVFSNEAGLGSAPIAHAAAKTDSPVRQGTIAMLGTFIDTLIICSITGLAIVVTGVWSGEAKGAAMSQAAFASTLPFGDVIISLGLCVFAFTTILGWSYYGERCAEYLLGTRVIVPYRVLWVIAVGIGAVTDLDAVWLVADILNGMMAVPNLIGLLLLSGLVAKLTKDHFAQNP
ncbi:MAG: sodium:alanine symporter family protein [Candidatus Pelagadaptatus aseana]|uniref:alanine/glycine:cation symporter family protein n=1 Tax=Candidatus Pelagadaptatus aseana TaxID=3120508 RepID=UPI0039B254A8